ncbi:MAG: hypothetical protein E6J05_17330 [Chloroflexi bacterium]|nr:MAG: hypothetical protein E6J05_17330 [Chloroflexota bacterium]
MALISAATLAVGFANQAFVGFPKGYDAYGHMSKVKFLVDNFPDVDWNYEWYSGQFFSEGSFPPLFHYVAGAAITRDLRVRSLRAWWSRWRRLSARTCW